MIKTEQSRREPGSLGRLLASCRDMTARDRRNVWRANGWLLVWVLSVIGVRLLMQQDLLDGPVFTWLAIAASTGLGILAVYEYVRFIREADELLRKIQLEALALGFAAGLVGNFTFSLIERATGHHFDLGDLLMVMVIGYMVGLLAGARRYA